MFHWRFKWRMNELATFLYAYFFLRFKERHIFSPVQSPYLLFEVFFCMCVCLWIECSLKPLIGSFHCTKSMYLAKFLWIHLKVEPSSAITFSMLSKANENFRHFNLIEFYGAKNKNARNEWQIPSIWKFRPIAPYIKYILTYFLLIRRKFPCTHPECLSKN